VGPKTTTAPLGGIGHGPEPNRTTALSTGDTRGAVVLAGERISQGEWIRAFRAMRFGTVRGVRAATIRAVGLTFASYADFEDGDRIYPGTALLAVHIYAGSALAYDVGHPVPVSNVVRHGYALNGQVALVDGADHAPDVRTGLRWT